MFSFIVLDFFPKRSAINIGKPAEIITMKKIFVYKTDTSLYTLLNRNFLRNLLYRLSIQYLWQMFESNMPTLPISDFIIMHYICWIWLSFFSLGLISVKGHQRTSFARINFATLSRWAFRKAQKSLNNIAHCFWVSLEAIVLDPWSRDVLWILHRWWIPQYV